MTTTRTLADDKGTNIAGSRPPTQLASDKAVTQSISDLFSGVRPVAGDAGARQGRSQAPRPNPTFPASVLNLSRRPASSPFVGFAGRTKPVVDGDIAGAFKSLGITLRNNNVAKDYRTQKFYEKPSDKRVRLNRERHRKRFLLGVKRLVGLVKEQRKFS